MNPVQTYQKLQEAIDFIKTQSPIQPEVGIVLGSGLGSIADEVENPISIPYTSIPHFCTPSVQGHAGKMIFGKIKTTPVVMLQGRFHFYEGHTMNDVVFPTRVLCRMGIHTLVLTNAAGGINTRYRAGDVMFIEDHINLTGQNPLIGPNLSEFGPRFPDMTEAYHQACLEKFKETAQELQIPFQTGIYAGLLGPTYETPAEVRMLRNLGADAVGMSTVSEAIAANHLGVRVAGMSCITNQAAGLSPHKLTHQEVIDNSALASEKMRKILLHVVPKLAQTGKTPR